MDGYNLFFKGVGGFFKVLYYRRRKTTSHVFCPWMVWQGSYSHEKSLNLKIRLPDVEKLWILGKMAEVMEKSWNFISLSKYFVLFENWKHSPSHQARIYPKKAGFSAFLSHGMVIEFFLPNFCVNSVPALIIVLDAGFSAFLGHRNLN